MDNTLQCAVEKCWGQGLSIGDTIKSIQRNHNVRLQFHDVQPIFAKLSQEAFA